MSGKPGIKWNLGTLAEVKLLSQKSITLKETKHLYQKEEKYILNRKNIKINRP